MAGTFFTVEEAKSLLPNIKRELMELKKLQKLSQYKFSQLNKVKDRRQPENVKRDSMFTYECELDFIEILAHLHVQNIWANGVQLKRIDPGMIYFPAKKDGQEAYLCWKEGEEKISYCQLEHEGTSGRKQPE